MPYSNIQSVQIDETLRRKALAYDTNMDSKFAHPQVCAKVEADSETMKVLVEDPEWGNRLPDLNDVLDSRSGDIEPLVLEKQLGTKNVTMHYLKVAMPVSRRSIENFLRKKAGTPDVSPKEVAIAGCVKMLKSIKEKNFCTTINTSSSYKTGHALSYSAGSRWDEAANDPNEDFLDIADLLELGGAEMNTLIGNRYALERIYANPFVQKRMFGSLAAVPSAGNAKSDEAFAAAFLGTGGKVVRAGGMYWSGEKGASSPTGLLRMIKDDVVFAHVNQDTVGLQPGQAPRTFFTMLFDPECQMVVYTVPMKWNRPGSSGGYYVVVEDSVGFFYAPDTVSNNKINNAVLVQDCVS